MSVLATSGDVTTTLRAVERECLVDLNGIDAQLTLFCVHTVSGQVGSYKWLADALRPDVSVWGFRARGLRGKDSPLRRVKDMASYYVAQATCVQPKGPYNICGWSTGGFIAVEMARQFLARGAEVGFLGLIDSGLFPERQSPDKPRDEVLAKRCWIVFYGTVLRYDDPTLQRDDHEFWRLNDEERLGYVCYDLRVRSRSELWRRASIEDLRRYFSFFVSQWRALRVDYRPRPYIGSAVYFQASETEFGTSPALWADVVRGGLRTIVVPGDHVSMLKEPDVRTLGMRVREALGAAGVEKPVASRGPTTPPSERCLRERAS
jgi:thioesterase domain-containing protein